ncbi:MAG: hypothetical protein AB1486_06275 [Planctomycetota bacterium]
MAAGDIRVFERVPTWPPKARHHGDDARREASFLEAGHDLEAE